MLSTRQHRCKRLFDLLLALLVLPLLIIPLLLLWLMASIDMGTNGLFVQQRIGRYGHPFLLYKLRTLKGAGHEDIGQVKAMETRFGHWLRKTKLDELPQLFNILKGDMSWVGPRPDVPGYADQLEGDDRELLELRPGLTGPATLKYQSEDQLLLAQPDPKAYNDQVIWPDKVKINRAYLREWSLMKDIGYIVKSIF
jgi:lipopolysaccharide/colanic/teichoic acid biosynthesis glycosyltransferase